MIGLDVTTTGDRVIPGDCDALGEDVVLCAIANPEKFIVTAADATVSIIFLVFI
jgi:hypothetical protein